MGNKEHFIRVRLTVEYKDKLMRYAEKKGTTVSEVIRAYIHRLPT